MACDILKGRTLACKDSRTGIRYVDFGLYTGDTYTVSAQEITSLPAGLDEVFRYEVKGAGNSLIETATVNNDNRTIEIVQALALTLPKLGKDTEVELQSLLYGRVVAFITDYNGNVKAVGIDSGLEATTEGPIKKDNGSSYLVGYRYSLAGIAQSMGINIGTTATPSYQDLSFKLNSGTTKMGKFSLFGIYGTSTIALESGGDKNSLYGNGNQADFSSKLGIIGLNHFKQINSKSYISSTIGLNYSKTDITNYGFDRLTEVSFQRDISKTAKTGYNFSTSYNSKINSRLFVKIGLDNQLLGLDLYSKNKQRISTR